MEVRGEFLIKHVIVCGDDFGMNADIDEAMISLAGLGRMSAVSCLTLGPTFWRTPRGWPSSTSISGCT